jgi:hypothetical protein
MSAELLPCAHCGTPPKPPFKTGGSDERYGYNFTMTVSCQCGASISRKSHERAGGWCDDTGQAESAVVEAWNRRASPANTAAATGERTLPGFIRREIEQAIEAAEHPKGMSLHDGKAHVLASSLRCMLTLIDARARPALTEGQKHRMWLDLTDSHVISHAAFFAAAEAIERHLNGSQP